MKTIHSLPLRDEARKEAGLKGRSLSTYLRNNGLEPTFPEQGPKRMQTIPRKSVLPILEKVPWWNIRERCSHFRGPRQFSFFPFELSVTQSRQHFVYWRCMWGNFSSTYSTHTTLILQLHQLLILRRTSGGRSYYCYIIIPLLQRRWVERTEVTCPGYSAN